MAWQVLDRALEIDGQISRTYTMPVIDKIMRQQADECSRAAVAPRNLRSSMTGDDADEGWPGAARGIEAIGARDEIEQDGLAEILFID